MISMVIATRNRAYTLRRVANTFFNQNDVSEIIFICDDCKDDTAQSLREIGKDYPSVKLVVVENEQHLGQAESRNRGMAHATGQYILFCDDDEYMQEDYARTCLVKLRQYGAGAVAGRRIYLRTGESCEDALARFGNGMRNVRPFYYLLCEYVNSARFEGDISLPLTNSIMLTERTTALQNPFDPFYSTGNGYREESDFQMRLFLKDMPNYTTNDTHTFHLPLTETRTVGQRVNRLRKVIWSWAYTRYFFGKYYKDYAKKASIRMPMAAALCWYALFAVYKECFRPLLRDLYVAMRTKP